MMRSNSIPAQESSFDLYGGSHVLGGSAVSLEEQPRGMSRSESFRDSMEEDLRIRRQHSSDSVSSMNSATSLSSVGSTNDAEAKKKKKKSWLRSSFKQAFGKKKSTKPPSPHSDIEELTDSSLPSSPKLPHSSKQGGIPSMKTSQSASE
ncbi:UNVERIFIED_CONTAM: hypothetical protein FKN15_059157 [Acipenser sinensis]